MNFIPAEININSQEGFDITLECSKQGIPSLEKYLITKGFIISYKGISISNTKNISDLIKLEIKGNEFNSLREAIIKFLELKNVKYTEDKFNSPGDLLSRFNLEDINVFDKAN